MRHDIVLDAGDLTLRPFALEDAALLVALAADPESRRWSRSLAGIRQRADGEAWIEARWRNESSYAWVIQAPDGRAGGRVALHRAQPDVDVEIGYGLLPHLRGLGYATRAALAVARYGHEDLGLPRIGLIHAVANVASCRVATAAGFPLEGTARREFEHEDGLRYDYHHHARLYDDPWPTA